MHCPNKLTYVLQQGDTLYKLAQDYQTTTSSLMALNPRLNPYNLQAGGSIFICPGDGLRAQMIVPSAASAASYAQMPARSTAMPATAMPATAMPATAMPATAMPATAMPAAPRPAAAAPAVTMPVAAMPATVMPAVAAQAAVNAQPTEPMAANADSYAQLNLSNRMREAWEQHIYWTRMLLVSIDAKLDDQAAVTDRLLQNPDDIARIFSRYYDRDITKTIAQMLTEHLQIGAELITALRDGKRAESLRRQWYMNADQMAEAFSRINPYYKSEELRKMLYKHLDLTTQEVAMRLEDDYQADIEAFDRVESAALRMADYFTAGLIQQFPQKFTD